MDLIVRGAEVLCGHHVLIWIWSTGQRVRMPIHGAPLSLSPSLYSVSPPRSERARHPPYTHTHTHTHTHTFWRTYTQKRMGYTTDEKVHISSLSVVLCSLSFKLSLNFPKVFLFSAVPCALSSHKDLVHSVTCIYLRGREQWREVQKAPWPSLPHLPSLGIFHIRAQTSALFWRSLKSLRSRGDKGASYLSVPGSGCLEWHIFPTLLFFFVCFFLNGKWSRDVKWDVGTQANRLDCGRTSLSKRETEGAHEKR